METEGSGKQPAAVETVRELTSRNTILEILLSGAEHRTSLVLSSKDYWMRRAVYFESLLQAAESALHQIENLPLAEQAKSYRIAADTRTAMVQMKSSGEKVRIEGLSR